MLSKDIHEDGIREPLAVSADGYTVSGHRRDAAALSSLYVSQSLHRCNCGDRWECRACRHAWVSKRSRTSEQWLRGSIGTDGLVWFAMFTLKTTGDWQAESAELFGRWAKLGKQRSQQRFRGIPHGLGSIRRGIGALHLIGRAGRFQPHLHGVIVSDPSIDSRSIIDAWQRLEQGFVDIQPARLLGAVVRYAIDGPLPNDPRDRKEISGMLHGVRMVRRLGK